MLSSHFLENYTSAKTIYIYFHHDEESGCGAGEEESGSATMRTAETLLRILPMALSVVALVIMLKDSHTNNHYGSLSYSDLGDFRYESMSILL